VLNGCRTALRRRARSAAARFAEPPAAESAEARLLLSEEQQAVARALVKLPHRQREALVLRRLRGWLAPVTAAAVVLAIAASLVLIRDIPNGRVVAVARPASSPAGPAYYVSLSAPATAPRNDLVVGDTRTGGRLANIAAPKGTVFGVVTAAADDRTFITDTVPTSGRTRSATWYLLRLSPGAASPARLTRLPIPATPAGLLGAAAVSGSGTELAVLLQPFQQMLQQTASTTTLRIYSVGTGRLLHAWSTRYQHIAAGVFPSATLNDSLSWVDGDRAVAFDTYRYVTLADSTGPSRRPCG